MLLGLIDDKVPKPDGLSEGDKMMRKNYAKEIITSRIDEKCYTKVLGIDEPKDILRRLRDVRKGEVSLTPTILRTKLYTLRMRKGERVDEFCERYNKMVREHEQSGDPIKLTEQEKRSTFYQAVVEEMGEVRKIDTTVTLVTNKEMDMATLSKTMYTIQEDNDAAKIRPEQTKPAASRARAQISGGVQICFRCNRNGHWKNECPLKIENKWFCFTCNKITDHHGNNCPSYDTQIAYQGGNKRMNSRNYEGPPAKRYRPEHQGSSREGPRPNRGGRGKFRGRGRGHNRGRGSYSGQARPPVVRRTQKDDEYEDYEAPEEDQGKI